MLVPVLSDRNWSDAAVSVYFLEGIESEETYPYYGKTKGSRCYFDKSQTVAYLDNGFFMNTGESNAARMMTEHGPLANYMNAAARSFQFYSKGKNHY